MTSKLVISQRRLSHVMLRHVSSDAVTRTRRKICVRRDALVGWRNDAFKHRPHCRRRRHRRRCRRCRRSADADADVFVDLDKVSVDVIDVQEVGRVQRDRLASECRKVIHLDGVMIAIVKSSSNLNYRRLKSGSRHKSTSGRQEVKWVVTLTSTSSSSASVSSSSSSEIRSVRDNNLNSDDTKILKGSPRWHELLRDGFMITRQRLEEWWWRWRCKFDCMSLHFYNVIKQSWNRAMDN